MMEINKHKTGLVVSSFVVLLHVLWSAMVALGWAQPVLNFIYQIHFLNNPYVVTPFGFKRVAVLLVTVAVWGYIVGWVFGFVFNKIHKQ